MIRIVGAVTRLDKMCDQTSSNRTSVGGSWTRLGAPLTRLGEGSVTRLGEIVTSLWGVVTSFFREDVTRHGATRLDDN